jgi:hypothetical protein
MKKAGEEATLTVVRGGEHVPVKVTLGEKEVPITAEVEPALGGGVRPGGFLPEGFQLQPGGAAPGWNMQHATAQVQTDGSSVKHLVDDQHDIEITRTRQGPATVVIKDRAGKELYRGPYETADDKTKVPADLAAKVKRLDEGVPAVTLSLSGRGNLAAQSVVFTRTDDAHVMGLRMDKDGKVLTVKDAKTGAVLFDGPINTDEERKTLPADVLPKLQAMEQRLGR